jgi:hypothetical protein
MEKEQRNALRTAVVKMRRLLEKDFQEQLEGTYNILPDGRVLESAPGDPVVRARLLDLAQHHRAGGATAPEAVDRVVREAAFTVLNRFAALKMAERRHLVRECVSQGAQSEAIRELAECAPGLRGALADGGYRLLLDAVADEISLDLKVLFNRRDSMAPLWPGPQALDDLLETLNDPDLADIWAQDEAIGWTYQYFNDNDVKEMRDAAKGGAPRNSRELAVRNQFFTPRYVVEFLTDNTLGRLWYEMTGGETALRERCRYLVRRPTEIFLKSGESAPASDTGGETGAPESLSQEELLRQPVYIPHRPLKDPRDIRLLDPACGSMHFGLYAFDLFTAIYEEAWDIAHSQDSAAKSVETFAPFGAFVATFPDKAAFLRDVPRLIVERNIHGIDIDPRATQIAGLSLWLRAQRAWHEAVVRPAGRPGITRSNLVCAEPMPGEKELLREFVEQQFPPGERPAFAFLLQKIFDRMTLAGEAGSLLRIEGEIRTAIADAKRLWKEDLTHEQAFLFSELGETAGHEQLRLDLSGITDEQFWERAEQRVYDALEAYAEQAENGGGFQRRLFAEDAAQGFAFIDLCRKRYDVVVMNPPFGEVTPAFKDYASQQFRRSKADLLCMFVERATQLVAPSCFCAAITNRTPFFTDGTEAWREAFVLGGESTSVRLFADLGHKVLDAALVETAAYSLTRTANQRDMSWFNVTQVTDKESSLLQQIRSGGSVAKLQDIEAIPGKRLSYWLPSSVVSCYAALPSLAGSVESVDKGMSTTDDFRFIRAFWEVPNAPSPDAWMYYSKGGEYSPFASDVHLTVKWHGGGQEISELIVAKYPYLNGDAGWVLHPETHHGLTGLTYTKRTTSSFSARLLPAGARVSDLANLVYDPSVEKLLGALVCLSTSPFHYLLDAAVPSIDSSAGGTAARHYEVGTLREVPVPAAKLQQHADAGTKLFRLAQERYTSDEATNYFNGLPLLRAAGSLTEASGDEERARLKAQLDTIELHSRAERSFIADYGLDEAALEAVYDYMGPHPATLPHSQLSQLVGPSEVWKQSEEQLTSLLVRTYGGKRRFSKQTWVGGREIELWAYVANFAPAELARLLLENREFSQRNSSDLAVRVVSYAYGVVLGRWDIRYATGERPEPELPDPFAPLPVCPPGMLQGDDGLPLSPEAGRQMRAECRYPLDVAWDGILVDEPEHSLDLERHVRAALAVLWGDRADAIEQEACALLGVPTLREWFRRPAGFFADHLKRYSKSRRQAPIYWPLSTASGSYTIWVYYHRLTADTLFQLAEHVELKLGRTREERLRASAGQAKSEGRESAKLANQASELVALEQELDDMRAELLRVAELPYKPDLNDGVQITAAPLWRLFRLSKWRKDLEATWKSLEKGEYDWAHLALSIRPEQVRVKCKTDRSLAIAHGLEELCQVEVVSVKKRRKKSSE